MSNKRPAEQWYSGDWFRSVDVRKCDWATRGIWREMLDIMVNEQITGKIQGSRAEICRVVGCTAGELTSFFDSNKRHKFANVTFRNGNVTIINRRLYKAFMEREGSKTRMRKLREKMKRNCYGQVAPSLSISTNTNTSSSIESISTNRENSLTEGLALALQKKAVICADRLEKILGPFSAIEGRVFLSVNQYLMGYAADHGPEIFTTAEEWAKDKRDYVERRAGKTKLDARRMFMAELKKRTGYKAGK